ncbi:ATP-binding cassette sub-family G member 3-like [Acomys russatus]|uniref:ATP-binding cassette sub-family G member 3-like n=1 Tax=Acomys russatus TaxID=60746 RepID=UPI0021E221BE|nr:ATP-binding cassette sub-family G member 3-like [Acomys russatus]
MSSNDDSVVIPMRGSNVAGMSTSDMWTLTEEAVLSFHNISYRETEQSGFLLWKNRRVTERLSNINGIMKPGLNAIMGPQDRDRSLLLNILAARTDPRGLSGDILINGSPRPANFTFISGYVAKVTPLTLRNDMVMHTVTVRDNLEFSAALRLPMTVTRDEKKYQVNEVLRLLQLEKWQISKELRKRTSIAVELLAGHLILFLDDPTTGLDLRNATVVISVLKRLSKTGRTIIFSINRPPYSIFRSFDSLTLVGSGKVMFHGPAQDALEYFKAAGYKYDSQTNPAEFFLDVLSGGVSAMLDTEEDGHGADAPKERFQTEHQVAEKLANTYAQSSLYNDIKAKLNQLLGAQKVQRSSAVDKITCVTPFWHQLQWIICRLFKNVMGFPRVTMTQAVIMVILAAAVGTALCFLKSDCVEIPTRAGLLFLLTVFQCMTSVTAGKLFVTDRDQFLHEHTSGYYEVSSYFFGKLLAELVPRRLFTTIIFTVATYVIVGVTASVTSFFTMMFTVLMLAFSVSSLRMSIVTGENTADAPMLPATIYFMFTLFFSGLSLYSGSFPPSLSWIQYLSIPHYGFRALLYSEFLGQNFCPENNTEEVSRCQNYVICTGEEFLATQGIDLSSWSFWENHLALACIMFILFALTYVKLLQHRKLQALKY